MWSVEESVALAREHVTGMGDRWAHLSTVGRVASALASRRDLVSEVVVSAAWVHDIGYSSDLVVTGLHPLDGAWFLQRAGAPQAVVALVGHHSGAAVGAQERGLAACFRELAIPDANDLDVLTMVDLAVGPSGQLMLDVDRIGEILSRYEEEDPVHRAVPRSRSQLLASSARGKDVVGLSDDWPLVADQGVSDAEPHGGVQL